MLYSVHPSHEALSRSFGFCEGTGSPTQTAFNHCLIKNTLIDVTTRSIRSRKRIQPYSHNYSPMHSQTKSDTLKNWIDNNSFRILQDEATNLAACLPLETPEDMFQANNMPMQPQSTLYYTTKSVQALTLFVYRSFPSLFSLQDRAYFSSAYIIR